ncbi:hypothetical protein AB0K41_43760, partial [Actinomadura coerulea]
MCWSTWIPTAPTRRPRAQDGQDGGVAGEGTSGSGLVPGREGGASRAVEVVQRAGGFAAQLSDIEEVSVFHGDSHEVLVHRSLRRDRAVMFELVDGLELVATSTDDSVLAALDQARAHWAVRRDFISVLPVIDPAVGAGWLVVDDSNDSGDVDGGVSAAGAGVYADWRANLLTWEQRQPLLEKFCAGIGLPNT